MSFTALLHNIRHDDFVILTLKSGARVQGAIQHPSIAGERLCLIDRSQRFRSQYSYVDPFELAAVTHPVEEYRDAA